MFLILPRASWHVFKHRGLDQSSGGGCGSDGTDLSSGESWPWECSQLPAFSCSTFRTRHSVQAQTTLSPDSSQSVRVCWGFEAWPFLLVWGTLCMQAGGPAETFPGLYLIWKLLLLNLPPSFSQASDFHRVSRPPQPVLLTPYLSQVFPNKSLALPTLSWCLLLEGPELTQFYS